MIEIGYWYSDEEQHLPNPYDYIDVTWDARERSIVIDYLKNGNTKHSWRGSSSCRICGCSNGSTCLTDGVYIWPEGLVHYVQTHNVRPPAEFVNHIKKMISI